MTRSAPLIASALLGCIGGPEPLERYRLAPVLAPSAEQRTASRDSTLPTIGVEPYSTVGIYADPKIVFRLGETTYGSYPNREWALPLGTMLADATLEIMRSMPAFGARVADDRAATSHQFVWRGVVQRFEEVNRGKAVSAAVRLDAALVRYPNDSIVWQGTASLERSVPDPTMPAIVDALSELTAAALRRLATDASGAIAEAERRPEATTLRR